MEPSKILQSELIDLLFEGRNKMYGAYELRKHYNRRLLIAMVVASGLFIMVACAVFIGNKSAVSETSFVIPPDITINDLQDKKHEIKPPPPPLQKAVPVETVRNTTLTIVPDLEVPDEALPPENASMETAVIGTMNVDGIPAIDIVAPPAEASGTGKIVAPKRDPLLDSTVYTTVQVVAEFPGGVAGWRRYLERNLRYPDAAIENEVQEVVRVAFIIDKVGNISDVKALNDPGFGLAQEAVRIIERGPKWKPAEQNGIKVIYRHVQSIVFRLH